MNAHEHVRRIRKVDAIVRYLQAATVTADEAERYSTAEINEIARNVRLLNPRVANMTDPSPTTWAGVVARLRVLESDESEATG